MIITAPADNKAQKEFLGYNWSNRKGNEGIQILTPGGKIYDDADRAAEGTLASAIKKSFCGLVPSFDEGLKQPFMKRYSFPCLPLRSNGKSSRNVQR